MRRVAPRPVDDGGRRAGSAVGGDSREGRPELRNENDLSGSPGRAEGGARVLADRLDRASLGVDPAEPAGLKEPDLASVRRPEAGERAFGAFEFWRRDRASLRGWSAFKNRVLRIAIFTVRGVSVHQLGLQAAALTYYTVFSLVPLLVVALWILKIFDRSPGAESAMPLAREMTKGNAALHAMLGRLLENVNHTSQVTGGIVGLLALLYAVVRLFTVHRTRARSHRVVDDAEAQALPALQLPGTAAASASAGPGRRSARRGLPPRHRVRDRSAVRLRRAAQARDRRRPGSLCALAGHRDPLFGRGARPDRLLVSGGRGGRGGDPARRRCCGYSPDFRSGCRAETASSSGRPPAQSFCCGRSRPGSSCCSAPRSPSATASTGS